ncbi:MAG: hypothetical protein OK455_00015 [Thaumarchaeota archaeon]|nr:hypothetical protein [Nitrososphaerota archaeon]
MQKLGTREEEELVKEIETYCNIARANGSFLSMDDLLQLTAVDASEAEVEEALRASPQLRSNLVFSSGYIIGKPDDPESQQVEKAIQEQVESKRRAISNLTAANDFARLLGDRASLVAVGGTSSYLSAGAKDDIDLFCITKRDAMWIFMLESLVKARVYGAMRKVTPQLCFSFIMDEGWAEREFRKPQDAIFARDVLTSKVVRGIGVYNAALRSAPWMDSFFPRLYRMRIESTLLKEPGHDGGTADRSRVGSSASNPWRKVVNSFLCATLGSYILLKAWLLNRRFAKEGRIEPIFTTDIGADHCVYESNKYKKIRRMYSPLHAR